MEYSFTQFSELLSGLVLIFFGLRFLSESSQTLGSSLIHSALGILTESRWRAFFVGFLVTLLLQSSSISLLMTLGFVNAGLLSLLQALSVVLGANLATTSTGWLLALGFSSAASWFLAAGVLWLLPGRFFRLSQSVKLLFSLGLVFLGLQLLAQGLAEQLSVETMGSLRSLLSAETSGGLLLATGFGTVLAVIFRQSILVIGLTMALLIAEKIALPEALPLLIGANFGTTLKGLWFSRKANIESRRTAWAHFAFNAWSAATALFFFDFILYWLEQVPWSPVMKLALAHSGLNLLAVFFCLPLLGVFVELVQRLIPSSRVKEVQRLTFLGSPADMAPSLAIEQAGQEVKKMAAMTQSLMSLTRDYVANEEHNDEIWQRIQKYERITDNIQQEMTQFLSVLTERSLTRSQGLTVRFYWQATDELENIADKCQVIIQKWKKLYDEGLSSQAEVSHTLDKLVDLVIDQYDLVFSSLTEHREVDPGEFQKSSERFRDFTQDIREHYFQLIFAQNLDPALGSALNEVSIQLREIRNHNSNIFEAHTRRHQWAAGEDASKET